MSAPQSPAQTPSGGTGREGFFPVFRLIMLTMFLAGIDQTIVAAALPEIAADLGNVERISWVVVAYLVAATAAAPVYGRLGDLLGRRRMLVVALLLLISASLMCALAQDLTTLTVFRVLQGLGGGGLMALAHAMIGESVPPRERARCQGYIAAVMSSSSAIGPVLGGFLTQYLGWQAVFLVNLPLGALALALVLRLPSRPGSGEPFRLDVPGLLLFSLFTASALVMLEQVKALDLAALPWGLALLGVTVASVVLLVRQEKRSPAPLLPPVLFSNPSIWRSDTLAVCHGATIVSLVTLLPIYFRAVHGTTPGETGLLVMPLTFGVGIGGLITGRLVSATGRTAVFPSFSLPLVAAGLFVMAAFAGELSRLQFVVLLVSTAFFLGPVMAVVQVTVQMSAGGAMLGSAAASVQLSRSLGAALGTALVMVVLFSVMSLADPEVAVVFRDALTLGPQALEALDGAARARAERAFAAAFGAAFLAIGTFAAAGAVVAWTIPLRRI